MSSTYSHRLKLNFQCTNTVVFKLSICIYINASIQIVYIQIAQLYVQSSISTVGIEGINVINNHLGPYAPCL